MSQIDDLSARLSRGLRCRRLGDVARIRNGRDYKCLGVGSVPVYGTGGVMTTVDTAAYDKPSVLIPRKGSLDKLYYVDEPFWTVDTIFYTEIDQALMLPKFLYYALATKRLEELNQAGGVPSLTQTVLNEVMVPVPPLEVQHEVVRVLDMFTSLEAELKAELEGRRRQYAHYRNSLMTFPEGSVRRVPISELFSLRNGYTPSKGNARYWSDGDIPWFRMEDLRENGRVLGDSMQHITAEAAKGGRLFPANSIIIATSATIGEHALITVPFLCNQRFTCLTVKPEYEGQLHMKFAFYYGFLLDEWCQANTTISSFAGVDMTRLRRFRFPLPTMAEQERIVAILDKFDALVNDPSIGLPAELAARRKQYEYYRDRLLTFKEAVA